MNGSPASKLQLLPVCSRKVSIMEGFISFFISLVVVLFATVAVMCGEIKEAMRLRRIEKKKEELIKDLQLKGWSVQQAMEPSCCDMLTRSILLQAGLSLEQSLIHLLHEVGHIVDKDARLTIVESLCPGEVVRAEVCAWDAAYTLADTMGLAKDKAFMDKMERAEQWALASYTAACEGGEMTMEDYRAMLELPDKDDLEALLIR